MNKQKTTIRNAKPVEFDEVEKLNCSKKVLKQTIQVLFPSKSSIYYSVRLKPVFKLFIIISKSPFSRTFSPAGLK